MTTQALRRQIDRAKTQIDAIKPKPEVRVTILIEPGQDAAPADMAAYLKKLAIARQNQDRIMVIRLKAGCPARDEVAGVRYVRNEWEAQMAVLAGLRSESGNADRLDDVLKGLSGNVMGAVANPPPDIHTSRMRRQVADVEDDE